MKCHILMTLYRRYFELEANLDRMRSLKSEFQERPKVYLVWAQPEEERADYVRKFVEAGDIDVVTTREKLPLEGQSGGVTYPESHNLRLGMNLIKQDSKGCGYILVQTADCFAYPGTYRRIDEDMTRHKLSAWGWRSRHDECPATNFFGVCMDEIYWPPVSQPDDPNVLEYQWKNVANLPGVKVNDSEGFFHSHDYNRIAAFLNSK